KQLPNSPTTAEINAVMLENGVVALDGSLNSPPTILMTGVDPGAIGDEGRMLHQEGFDDFFHPASGCHSRIEVDLRPCRRGAPRPCSKTDRLQLCEVGRPDAAPDKLEVGDE